MRDAAGNILKNDEGNKLRYTIEELIYDPVNNPNGILIEVTEQFK